MKNKVFIPLFMMLIFFSCSEENESDVVTVETANLETQKTRWKAAAITDELLVQQQHISHYEFNVFDLQSLIDDRYIVKVWFDIGLTDDNRITFTATGENEYGEVIGEVPSQAINQQRSKTDFSIFNSTREVTFDIAPEQSHILPHQDAYRYLTSVKRTAIDFEQSLLQDGQRVERFSLNPGIVQRILNTKNIHSLALFPAQNDKEKLTTVFIAKDKGGNLLIDDSQDITTAGRAFDFTTPCPNNCGQGCQGELVCVSYCSIFGFEYCCERICVTDDTEF